MSESIDHDIISLCLKHGALFSDLDKKTKDALIEEICRRIISIENERREIFTIEKSEMTAT